MLKAGCGKDETILFMDATHPTQATKITHGWIFRGESKAIKTTGSRTRLNIVGALDLSDIGGTVVADYERINGESIIDFFKVLRKRYPQSHKLHLILDGAGYHRSELVKDEAEAQNIKLHYLPPYSPNLNAIERLWKVMNEQVRNNVYFKSKQDFVDKIKGFFSKILPKIAASLSTRINDNFEVLVPASSV